MIPNSTKIQSVVSTTTPKWLPARSDILHIQFTELSLDLNLTADIYDLDLFDTSSETITGLHNAGKHVICYLNAGSWENWRPDKGDFPREIIGRDYPGWSGEKWLNIRRLDLLEPIILARLELCAAKGFDGVDPDNLDGFDNLTGFQIQAEDQLTFNHWLANQAHQRGLAIGLKNDPLQIPALVKYFDWALAEECFSQGWCVDLIPFLAAGKPVFDIEYSDQTDNLYTICIQAARLDIQVIQTERELGKWATLCPWDG